jgi:hypothetical protein
MEIIRFSEISVSTRTTWRQIPEDDILRDLCNFQLRPPSEKSQMLEESWKVFGFCGGDYEEWRLLGCYAV